MDDKFPRKTEKPWGYELLYALTPQYAGKVLFVKKGSRLSLQYHKEKDESQYLLSGKVLFTVQSQNGKATESIAGGRVLSPSSPDDNSPHPGSGRCDNPRSFHTAAYGCRETAR